MTIDLRPVDADNWLDVIALSVHPEQEELVPSTAWSLAEAYIKPEAPRRGYYPLAAYDGDQLVGFLSITCSASSDRDYWINGLVIDKSCQGKGYGRATMIAAMTYIKTTFPQCIQIGVTIVPGNDPASGLYASLGFVDTGIVYDGEIEWICKVKD
ncbi:MAG: GNAT family N-acetyltransferase [candidate division Zixibacteria bacterium]|nr:GNAT family N-acetyltransferase [candidate division Zixibacteria bacterium]